VLLKKIPNTSKYQQLQEVVILLSQNRPERFLNSFIPIPLIRWSI